MRIQERLPFALPSPSGAPPFALPPESDEEGAHGLSLFQVLTVLGAYWKVSTAIAVVCVGLSAALIKMMPKLYTATATVMMSYEVNDPLAGKEFPLGLLASYMATQIEIMQSREVLITVVDQLGLTHNPDFTRGYSGGPRELRDWVKDEVADSLTVAQGNFQSQLIYIKASARSPVTAAALANAVANVYLEQHVGHTEAPAETAARYQARVAGLKSAVETLEQKIAKFREQNGITDLNGVANDAEQNALNNLEQRYQEAQNTRRAAEVRQAADQTESDQAVNSVLVQNLKTQLSNEQAELAEKRATLGPRHPRILELESQIQATQQSLESALRAYVGGTSVDLAEARRLEEKLRSAVEEQRARVVKLRNIQDEGSNLTMQLESAQTAYKRALDSGDVVAAPTTDPYSNAHLLTRAEPPVRSDKPNKPKLFLMACAGGVGLGLVLPLLYELLLHRRIRCRDDLERTFGIDVLMELGVISERGGSA